MRGVRTEGGRAGCVRILYIGHASTPLVPSPTGHSGGPVCRFRALWFSRQDLDMSSHNLRVETEEGIDTLWSGQ